MLAGSEVHPLRDCIACRYPIPREAHVCSNPMPSSSRPRASCTIPTHGMNNPIISGFHNSSVCPQAHPVPQVAKCERLAKVRRHTESSLPWLTIHYKSTDGTPYRSPRNEYVRQYKDNSNSEGPADEDKTLARQEQGHPGDCRQQGCRICN
jgi:hypothetical protein